MFLEGRGACVAMAAQPMSRHMVPAYNASRKHPGVTPPPQGASHFTPLVGRLPALYHVYSAGPSISQGPSSPHNSTRSLHRKMPGGCDQTSHGQIPAPTSWVIYLASVPSSVTRGG